MALQGNIKDIPLTDLIDLITRNDFAGILKLSYHKQGDYQATILVKSGSLYAAQLVSKSVLTKAKVCQQGEPVLYALLSLDEAAFQYELLPNNYQFPEQNIFSSKREILLASIFNSGQTPAATPLAVPASAPVPTAANPRAAAVPPHTYAPTLPSLRASEPQLATNTANTAARPTAKVQRGWLSSVISYIKNL